jgi:hypothetical protein
MRHMMEALFARVDALQQNQAVQLSGVNDRLDAVELEIPLIQEQSALRIRDLESRMSAEIEEAARSAAEEATAGIHEEVAGKFGSLSSLFESQRSELMQLRDSKRETEDRLSRVILDVERLCGNLAPKAMEEIPRPMVESPASPYRSRIAEHIRKAALEAAPDDSNPLVGDPALKKPMTEPTPPETVVAAPGATHIATVAKAAAPIPSVAAASRNGGVQKPAAAAMQVTSPSPVAPSSPAVVPPTTIAAGSQTVPGFDDWKRQFMQDGDPLHPTLTPEAGKQNKLVICPRCYSERTRPATLTRIDALFRLTGYSPHRCKACAHRFYKRGATAAPGVDEEGVEGRTEEVMETR